MNRIFTFLLGLLFVTDSVFAQPISLNTSDLKKEIIRKIYHRDLSPSERINHLQAISAGAQNNSPKMRLDSFVYYDSTAMLNSFKTLYFYDTKQRNTSLDFFLWDNTAKIWMGFIHGRFIYDDKNQIIESQTGDWNNQTNMLDVSSKQYNEFNNKGILIKDSTYILDAGVWVLDEKTEYTLSNDKVTSATEYSYYDDKWNYYKKNEYKYDARGNLIEDTDFYWESFTEKWDFDDRLLYSYNNNDQIIELLATSWDFNASQFINKSRIETTYNGLGLKSAQLEQEWDLQSSSWLNTRYFEVTYSQAKNPIKILIYSWDKIKMEWTNINLFLNTFDETISQSDLILPVLDIFSTLFQFDAFANGRPIAVAYYEQRRANGEWKSRNRISFYYSQQEPNANEDLNKKNKFIFPNPAEDELFIDLQISKGNYSIYSLDGIEVMRGIYQYGSAIDVSKIPGGIYLLKVYKNKNHSYQYKFIKI